MRSQYVSDSSYLMLTNVTEQRDDNSQFGTAQYISVFQCMGQRSRLTLAFWFVPLSVKLCEPCWGLEYGTYGREIFDAVYSIETAPSRKR